MKRNLTKMTMALAIMSSIANAGVEGPAQLGRVVKNFNSHNGMVESCIALAKLPLGEYKKKDIEEEQRLCGLDFHNDTLALCSKTWSTSPATIVASFKNVDGKDLAHSSVEAEDTLCGKDTKMDKVAKFKQTMNQADTSGTYSGSSILYYHFSRALDTDVNIPVAVYRTMDKDEHLNRVSSKAKPPASARMNVAGWKWLRQAETNPATYNATSDLFTSDKKQIYGALLKDKGERYHEEINGTRASGWGEGQNLDFQKTPAFLALKSEADLQVAMQQGYSEAIKDPKMKGAFPAVPSIQQMTRWMNELSEIVILDYIFSQQDRIGNIDFRWYWTYVDAKGEVQDERVKEDQFESVSRAKMAIIKMPAALAGFKPILIQKTYSGDNDAGGLVPYANYTKKTKMLEGLRHLNKSTYQRLLKLAKDFKEKGPNYQVLRSESTLLNNTEANKRFGQMTGNTILAASILESTCRTGKLKLDVVSLKKAMKLDFNVAATNCSIE